MAPGSAADEGAADEVPATEASPAAVVAACVVAAVVTATVAAEVATTVATAVVATTVAAVVTATSVVAATAAEVTTAPGMAAATATAVPATTAPGERCPRDRHARERSYERKHSKTLHDRLLAALILAIPAGSRMSGRVIRKDGSKAAVELRRHLRATWASGRASALPSEGAIMTKMRAVQVSKAGGAFEVVEREVPQLGPTQIRIKVEACGMCHSDALVRSGAFPGLTLPRIPGHEIAGRVDAVGAHVTEWKAGDRVGVGWHGGHCFVCNACRKGLFINCEKRADHRHQLRRRLRRVRRRAARGGGAHPGEALARPTPARSSAPA